MGKHEAPDSPHVASDVSPMVVIEVTVLPSPDAGASPNRVAGADGAAYRRAIAAFVLVLTITTAMTLWLGARHPAVRVVNSVAGERGAAGVAAAYGYPLRCLTVTILANDPTHARADFNHLTTCGRYTGYPTVIFHYDSGAWRIVLDAVAYFCPVDSLPAAVQTDLGVCQEPGAPRHAVNQ
jgi:hypothetical protein